MPNLQVDPSLLQPRQQPNPTAQMGLADLIKTGREAGEYVAERSLSEALKNPANWDEATGAPDTTKVLNQHLGGGGLVRPADVTAVAQMGHQVMGVAKERMVALGNVVAPLVALGPKVTSAHVAGVMPNLVKIVGKEQAGNLAKMLQVPDGQPLANVILNLKQSTVGEDTSGGEQVPTAEGGPPATVSHGQAERMRAGLMPLPRSGGAGAPGIVSSDVPEEFKEAQHAAMTFTDRTTPLVNAMASVSKLPEHTTGKLGDEWNELKKGLGGLGFKLKDQTWDEVNTYDQLKKALVNVNDQMSHGNTDYSLLHTISGNPNTTMDTASIKVLTKMIYAQEARRKALFERFIQAKDQTGGSLAPSQYNQWRARHDTDLDPRAFAFRLMSTAEQRKLMATMPEASPERLRFMDSFEDAEKHMQPPAGGWYPK
jgi:hypothetical protein